MRFRDKIDLRIDVPEGLLEYRTLKLLLQPLVENAILHGIMEKETQTGTITILGRIDGDTIELVVEDNGIGMEDGILRGILDGTVKKEIGGYGMRNIHIRLELIFRYPFGLAVESRIGEGTRVMVRIPVQGTGEEAEQA